MGYSCFHELAHPSSWAVPKALAAGTARGCAVVVVQRVPALADDQPILEGFLYGHSKGDILRRHELEGPPPPVVSFKR